MSPRSQPIVSWMIGQRPCSLKTRGLMMGCCMLAIGGIVCQVRKVKASWWDLSTVLGFPLSSSQSTNYLTCHYQDLTQPTHRKIQRPTSVPVPLYCSFVMILTTPLCLWIHVLCLDFSLSQSHLITPSFCDNDISAYYQPHSDSADYTLSIFSYWSMRWPYP